MNSMYLLRDLYKAKDCVQSDCLVKGEKKKTLKKVIILFWINFKTKKWTSTVCFAKTLQMQLISSSFTETYFFD